MSVCIEFELEIFSLPASESLTAECSCGLMWLPVAEPCGDWCCCQLNLLTNTLSQTYVLGHTYGASMHIQKANASVQYTHTHTHGLTFSCECSSHKSRRFVLLSESQKSRRSRWSCGSRQSHTHTHSGEREHVHTQYLWTQEHPNAQAICQRMRRQIQKHQHSAIFTIFLPCRLSSPHEHIHTHPYLWKVFPLTAVTPSHTFIDSHVCVIMRVLFWKSCT